MAEATLGEYEQILQREEEPELLIDLPRSVQPKDVLDPMSHATLRIDYSVSASGIGVHFDGVYAVVDNEVRRAILFTGSERQSLLMSWCMFCEQVRRARAWFPCVDTPASAHPFELLLTVPEAWTAVGPGQLARVSQTLDRRKTFHYRLDLDTPPCHISFACGETARTPCQPGGYSQGQDRMTEHAAGPFSVVPGFSSSSDAAAEGLEAGKSGGGLPRRQATGTNARPGEKMMCSLKP